jgi:hypothetical protein
MSVKLEIENKLIELYKAILMTGGYSFDINDNRVYYHRAAPVDDTDISISVYTERDEIDSSEGKFQNQLEIRVVLAGKLTGRADLDYKIQDVLTATALIENESFCQQISVDEILVDWEQEGSLIGEVTFNFTLMYNTDRWSI